MFFKLFKKNINKCVHSGTPLANTQTEFKVELCIMKNKNSKKQIRQTLGAVALLFGAVACGKQSFSVSSSQNVQSAPGTYFMPPRVDILLAQDDTGSMAEVQGQVAAQMPEFLDGLSNTGWDFHFASTQLTSASDMTQIAGSKFDPNWGAEWIPPFPGAPSNLPGTISSFLFRKPHEFNAFLSKNDISSGTNGQEKGFETISHVLKNKAQNTNFLRDDALLVVLVVGNGNDTSGVNLCPRSGDGLMVPCSDGSAASSLSQFRQDFQAMKPSASQFKLYAAVAGNTQCLGASAFVGSRYIQMAKDTGGEHYNICSTSVTSVLDGLSTHLHQQRGAFRTRYIFIEQDAERSSIVVTKYVGGNPNQAVNIPEDPNNGWTYAGKVENVHAISEPSPMNLASGYAIELHGSARLQGDDTAGVTYNPAGAKPSTTK